MTQQHNFFEPVADPTAFDNSPCREMATNEEQAIAWIIFTHHRSRHQPVSIAALGINTGLSERTIKGIIEKLRVNHRMPIGARRDEKPGYFWIVDQMDQEIACIPFRNQVLTMFKTLRVLDSPKRVRELLGQLQMEVE